MKRFNETENKYEYQQALFPIVQGSTFSDLRKQSAEIIASCNCLLLSNLILGK